jgi:hypothetical protein
MAAPEIGAIDQEAANASGAHFSERDLLGGHPRLKRGRDKQATNLAVRGPEARPRLGLGGLGETGAVKLASMTWGTNPVIAA